MKLFLHIWCWVRWKLGLRAPWVNLPPLDPWSSTSHGEHKIEAISRHAIAEAGLVCPRCLTEVCARGDFTKVREGKIGAVRNEVIICDGTRDVNGHEMPCGAILAASPDTEHGDNHLWDRVPENQRADLFFRFRRISEEDALKEKYGFDVSKKDEQMIANPASAKTEPEEERERLTYAVEDVYVLSNGRMGRVTEVMQEHDGDKHYAGWAIIEIDGDGVRWFTDPYGTVHRDMTDPTMNNLRIVRKQQVA